MAANRILFDNKPPADLDFRRPTAETPMPKIEHCHWPDAPDMWMPFAPAIKAHGGTTVYLAGCTAAPVYHHHPHRPEEFDSMPRDMEAKRAPRSPM